MPLIVKCKSCGFVLYKVDEINDSHDLKSVIEILDKWGRRCPCCMSPLNPFEFEVKIRPLNRRKGEK